MNRKTTLILLLLVVSLGLYLWFVERKKDSPEEREAAAEKAFRLKPDDVTGLALEKGALNVECRREDGEWILESPVRARADAGKVQRILWDLDNLSRRDVIRADELKAWGRAPADYGLDAPAARIRVQDGSRQRTLRVGRDSPLGQTIYVQEEGRGDILVTDAGILDAIPATLEEFRDRRLLVGDEYRVSRLEIQRDEGFLQLSGGDNGDWKIQQPLAAGADGAAVRDLLRKLLELRVEQFVADAVAEPAAYGLDSTAMEVTLRTTAESAGQTLSIGKAVEDKPGQVYARVSGYDSVYSVPATVLDLVKIKTDALRDRRLVTLPQEKISGIRAQQGEQILQIRRGPDAAWQIVAPVEWKADAGRIREFLDAWTAGRIEKFPDKVETNLATRLALAPDIQIHFALSLEQPAAPEAPEVGEEANVATGGVSGLTLSLCRDQEDGSVWARRDDEPHLYPIPPALLESVSVDPLSFRDRELLAMNADEVSRLSVTRGSATQSLVRVEDGSFKPVEAADGMVDGDALADLLRLFANVRAVRFVLRNPPDLGLFGLDEPPFGVTFGLKDGAGIEKTLLLGGAADPAGVYAMIRGEDTVCVLDRALREVVARPLVHPAPLPKE